MQTVFVRTYLWSMSSSETSSTEFLPTRRTLLTRLRNWDDQEGWREFFETYWRLIYSVAIKAGLNEADAQDIVQETIVAVARKMRRFHYDPAIGSFKTWLMLIVRSRIADHLRRRRCRVQTVSPAPRDDSGTALIEQVPDADTPGLEALWELEWKKGLFDAALERVRKKVPAKQFQIFDLCTIQQVSPKTITASLGVSLGQVYLIKHRVGRMVRNELRRLETHIV
jgi:RNA polymerase sigma factor (sigma-70 family)